jgi:hypothetical protein
MPSLTSAWSWIADHPLAALGTVVVVVAVVAVGWALRMRQRVPAPPAPAKKARLGERLEDVRREAAGTAAPQPAAPPAAAPADRARRPAPAAAGPAGATLPEAAAEEAYEPAPAAPTRALELEAGRLAYRIPQRMWLGVVETVEVRLGRLTAQGLMQDFGGSGDVRTENTPIVETMSVSLVCEPGAFEIEPRSERDQLVKPDLVKGTPFQKDDFGKWVWLVTPRQRGEHTLLVKVSAAIRDSRGLPSTSSLPDKIIAVTVRVHLVRATLGAIARAAPGIAWAVVTALVGVFTKDYWWPAIRNWLGW